MAESETDTENTIPSSPTYPFPEESFTVLKKADVELLVGGKSKTYSVVIKVRKLYFLVLILKVLLKTC